MKKQIFLLMSCLLLVSLFSAYALDKGNYSVCGTELSAPINCKDAPGLITSDTSVLGVCKTIWVVKNTDCTKQGDDPQQLANKIIASYGAANTPDANITNRAFSPSRTNDDILLLLLKNTKNIKTSDVCTGSPYKGYKTVKGFSSCSPNLLGQYADALTNPKRVDKCEDVPGRITVTGSNDCKCDDSLGFIAGKDQANVKDMTLKCGCNEANNLIKSADGKSCGCKNSFYEYNGNDKSRCVTTSGEHPSRLCKALSEQFNADQTQRPEKALKNHLCSRTDQPSDKAITPEEKLAVQEMMASVVNKTYNATHGNCSYPVIGECTSLEQLKNVHILKQCFDTMGDRFVGDQCIGRGLQGIDARAASLFELLGNLGKAYMEEYEETVKYSFKTKDPGIKPLEPCKNIPSELRMMHGDWATATNQAEQSNYMEQQSKACIGSSLKTLILELTDPTKVGPTSN